jgi:hypothetical protein
VVYLVVYFPYIKQPPTRYEHHIIWLVVYKQSLYLVWNMAFIFMYGMSSFPMSNSFFRGVGKPPTSYVYVIDPLVMTNSLPLKMAIEIVDFPIKNGGFP